MNFLIKHLFFILFTLGIAFANPVVADPAEKEHGHKTPHGGIVQEAEGMHAEFLLDKSGQPKLFLYAKDMKPLERSDLEARLTIKGHGGTEQTRALKFSQDAKEGPFFTGEPMKGLSDWDTAVVSLKVKDQWHHIRFSHH